MLIYEHNAKLNYQGFKPSGFNYNANGERKLDFEACN